MIKLIKLFNYKININILLISVIFILTMNLMNDVETPAFSKWYKLGVNKVNLDFSSKEISEYKIILSGISGWEPWGRWVDGDMASIDMPIVMSGNIIYKLKFGCLSSNQPQGMYLYFGDTKEYVLIGECTGGSKFIEKKIYLKKFSQIKIIPNYYVNVPGDPRKLSIGLISIELKNDL